MNKIVRMLALMLVMSLWSAFAIAEDTTLGMKISVAAVSDIKISPVTVDVKETNIKIKGTYPEITSDDKYAKQFNKLVKEQVDSQIAIFKKNAKENEQYMDDLDPDRRFSEFTFSYDIYTVQFDMQKIISIRLNAQSMIAGAAHSSHPRAALNFDLTNGKRLTLASLLKANKDYLNTLSSISFAMLNAELKKTNDKFDASWLKEGTEPKLTNFVVWNITDKGLQLTFPEYQVAPYSDGEKTITIPYV